MVKKIVESVEDPDIEEFSDDEEPSVDIEIPEEAPPPPQAPIKKKKGRTMTPAALDQLKRARETALQKKQTLMKNNEDARVKNEQHYTAEKAYHGLNEKIDRLNDRFGDYLEEKKTRRANKLDLNKFTAELPAKVNKQLMDDELKKRELDIFRKRMFGF